MPEVAAEEAALLQEGRAQDVVLESLQLGGEDSAAPEASGRLAARADVTVLASAAGTQTGRPAAPAQSMAGTSRRLLPDTQNFSTGGSLQGSHPLHEADSGAGSHHSSQAGEEHDSRVRSNSSGKENRQASAEGVSNKALVSQSQSQMPASNPVVPVFG